MSTLISKFDLLISESAESFDLIKAFRALTAATFSITQKARTLRRGTSRLDIVNAGPSLV